MKRRWKGFPAFFTLLLTMFTVFALLDTFVIPHTYSAASAADAGSSGNTAAYAAVDTESTETAEDEAVDAVTAATESHPHPGKPSQRFGEETNEAATETTEAAATTEADRLTDTTYTADGLTITLNEYRVNDTTVYVADVTVDDASRLKTALAGDTYGRNVTGKTSSIAASNSAVLAINGDFYGARTTGYVIRNGVLYRDTSSGGEDLVIWADGSFSIVNETQVTAQELLDQGAVQVFSFGPALVENGAVSVSESDEVGKAMASNPRTAIGILENGHYVLVVSDGRTGESEGLSLRELADFMAGLGVTTAYNLDGGGSSTMVIQGQVVNKPTTSGNSIKERSVSDIVYVS